MKAYPPQLRDRVLAACDAGQPTKVVAERFLVSPAWVRRLKQRRRETGETRPRPWGGRRFVKIDPEMLRRLWAEKPDRTLLEYQQLLAEAGVVVCNQSISERLIKMGLR